MPALKMKNVIQTKAKENQRQSGGDQKSVSQKSDELIREIHSERQNSAAAKSDSQKSDEAIFEPNANRKFDREILAIQGEKGNKKKPGA